MKTYVLILAVALLSYSSGILIESIAYGQDSKLQSLVQTGTLSEKWIPFKILPYAKANNFEIIASFDADSMTFLKEGHLDIGDSVLTNGYVDFKIEVENVDGKFLANKVTECIFQPEETIPEITCLVCELIEADGVTIAADGNIDLAPVGLVAFQPETILVDPTSPWSDNVGNIHKVRIKACIPEDGGGEGCTPGFWRQTQHFPSWELPLEPTDSYRDTFGLFTVGSIVLNTHAGGGPGGILTDPIPDTIDLLDAVWAKGDDKEKLARHGTAALLNAANPGVSYDLTTAQVIELVQIAWGEDPNLDNDPPFSPGDFNDIANVFVTFNEQVCDPDSNPTATATSNSLTEILGYSETGGVDSTTYDGSTATPYEKKQYSLEQLNTLVTDPTITQSTIDYLNTAIANLQVIVNTESYWVDDYHVDIVMGQFVLDNSEAATTTLILITNSGESQTFKDSVQAVIDELVAADSLLAQTAVDDIAACGGKNSKIDNHLSNAQTKLTQAQQDANDKKYDMAIQKFYDAWFEAFQATTACPSGYWTELEGYTVVP